MLYKQKHLLTLCDDEMSEWIKEIGEAPFRLKQIKEWIYSKLISEPDKMKNLPMKLREKLKNRFITREAQPKQQITDSDGTIKLLIEFPDKSAIESVIIKMPDSMAFCLSTQIGCPVQCRFCASGASGFIRNLSTEEILEQFYLCAELNKERPDNIVFMGIGEPLMNYSNLMDSIKILCSHDRIGMSPRRITVSTSGLPSGINKLAKENIALNLAVSLHAPDDFTRAILIPDKHRFPLANIIKAARNYFSATGRIITFEYVLIAGINDSRDCAIKLAEIASNCFAKINLIPLNENKISQFKAPPENKIRDFQKFLEAKRIKVTRRIKKGSSSSAACGQLVPHLRAKLHIS